MAGGRALPGFLCSALSFHFPNSLLTVTAFFPLSLPFCSPLPPLLILSGPHFLSVSTLRADLFEVAESQCCPVAGCYSEAPSFSTEEQPAIGFQRAARPGSALSLSEAPVRPSLKRVWVYRQSLVRQDSFWKLKAKGVCIQITCGFCHRTKHREGWVRLVRRLPGNLLISLPAIMVLPWSQMFPDGF